MKTLTLDGHGWGQRLRTFGETNRRNDYRVVAAQGKKRERKDVNSAGTYLSRFFEWSALRKRWGRKSHWWREGRYTLPKRIKISERRTSSIEWSLRYLARFPVWRDVDGKIHTSANFNYLSQQPPRPYRFLYSNLDVGYIVAAARKAIKLIALLAFWWVSRHAGNLVTYLGTTLAHLVLLAESSGAAHH